ncbi:ABC transporter ATP-binding protein [Micromonospora foliorum]|uniref:ABC transporter ATP-binding protein n=1 Tax=Micromonospora foliorum TaxID=2911210 RepID=UPI001EE7F7E2|nr:ATP-binding cassette domain-containing protein [Micromonospora foliorum]MCG5435259.1 ATP-binding cassette domain-containing protein [Micromonospora foliorum]
MSAIVAESLRKAYGGVAAVDGLDLTVAPGEMFGFLGPNGAGKSTTIAMLCTLTRPDSGHASVAGFDVVRSSTEVRRLIGLVLQESTTDGDLTLMENLRLHDHLYGLPRRTFPARARHLLDLFGLAERHDRLARTLSGGMRRRLEIARGLLHEPAVLFLDEPTAGLDPHSRADVWNHIHALRRDRPLTVFLTTHHLEEAEHCDRILVLDRGRAVVRGTPEELKATVRADVVRLNTADDARAAMRIRRDFACDATVDAQGVRVVTENGAALVPRLCAALDTPINAVHVSPPTLNDVFLHHTGRAVTEGEYLR